VEPSKHPSQKLFIVVIDDSATVCRLLEALLTQEGHQVMCFQHPVPALRFILKTGETPLPDLLFIDLTLPNINGFEMIRRFKNHQATQHIPIIVISRLGDAITRLKARLAGANAYLEKPFQAQDVLTLVRSFAAFTNPTIPENK
jgi:DNA-binding response OmpR family regulator